MNKTVFLFFILACILTLFINVFATHNLVTNLFTALNERRNELNEIYNYEIYLSHLKDAETGQRGFVITNYEEYLEPYKEAIKYFNSPELKEFLEDEKRSFDAAFSSKLLEIQDLVKQKMHELERVVNIMKEKGFAAAQEIIKTKKGKRLMDQVRTLVGSLIETKQKKIDQMDTDIQKSMDHTVDLLIISNSIAAVVLGLCLFSIYRAGQKLQMKEKELSLALKKLSESSAIQEGILNSSNYAIIATDTDGKINLFNPAAEKILGYKKEEMIGLQTPEIFHDPKEVEERALVLSTQLKKKMLPGFETFVALPKEGMADTNEWTYIRKDGTRFPVMLCVTANKTEKGEIIGYTGIAYDITERKEINRMKNELITITSHEIRSPIVAIKGSLDLLSQPEFALNEKAKTILELGQKNTLRLVRLTEDILDMQKIEAGKVQFNFKKVNVSSFLSQAIPSLKFAAQQSHISLIYIPVPAQWNIKADEDRLMQVLNNLVSNAIKFSPQGSKVEVSAKKMDSKIRFEIHDQGKGISEEQQSKILGQMSTNEAQGSGLGLSIAKTIIEKHAGVLSFHTSDQGTLFWFELPIEET